MQQSQVLTYSGFCESSSAESIIETIAKCAWARGSLRIPVTQGGCSSFLPTLLFALLTRDASGTDTCRQCLSSHTSTNNNSETLSAHCVSGSVLAFHMCVLPQHLEHNNHQKMSVFGDTKYFHLKRYCFSLRLKSRD